MSTVDIIIIVCFIPALIGGFSKGFILQLFSILSIVIGVWVAFHFSELLCPYIAQYIPDLSPTILHVTSFAVVFLFAAVILSLLGRLVGGIIKLAMLGWMDKLLGVVFALLKAAIIVGIVLILFNSINTTWNLVSEQTLEESILYGPIKDFSYKLFPFLKALIFKQ